MVLNRETTVQMESDRQHSIYLVLLRQFNWRQRMLVSSFFQEWFELIVAQDEPLRDGLYSEVIKTWLKVKSEEIVALPSFEESLNTDSTPAIQWQRAIILLFLRAHHYVVSSGLDQTNLKSIVLDMRRQLAATTPSPFIDASFPLYLLS